MTQSQEKPYYPCAPIGSVSALSAALGCSKEELILLEQRQNTLYRENSPKNGRLTYEALPPLKKIQKKIKEKILYKIQYPVYLFGGIKGKSSPQNGEFHIRNHNKKIKIIFHEDITNFFNSCSEQMIRGIWQRFFQFPPVVAELLTKLTTYKGFLPQGASTSSFLANLVFWETEHLVFRELAKLNCIYSRYIDDISVSSTQFFNKDEKHKIVQIIYNMIDSCGLKPKKSKHRIETGKDKKTINQLTIANGKMYPKKALWEHAKSATYQYIKTNEIKFLHRASGKINTITQICKKSKIRVQNKVKLLEQEIKNLQKRAKLKV